MQIRGLPGALRARGADPIIKTFAKILLGIVGVIALAIAAVFYLTADMTTVADEFFRAVKANDMDKAYI